MGKYDDIIKREDKGVEGRMHMSNSQRAAQFAPFAALTGYGDMIEASNIIYDTRKELSEDELDELNRCINVLKKNDTIKVVYFDSGYYKELTGKVTRIDLYEKTIRIDDLTIRLMNLRTMEIIESVNG